MKSIVKAKKLVVELISSLGDFVRFNKRVKGLRAQEDDEFVTLEQFNEVSGENVARLDLENVFMEDNYFEKPVGGQDAEEEDHFVTLRQMSDAGQVKTVNDIEPDSSGNVEVGVGDIVGLPAELDLKAEDAEVMHKTGDEMSGPLQVPSLTNNQYGDGFIKKVLAHNGTNWMVGEIYSPIAITRGANTAYRVFSRKLRPEFVEISASRATVMKFEFNLAGYNMGSKVYLSVVLNSNGSNVKTFSIPDITIFGLLGPLSTIEVVIDRVDGEYYLRAYLKGSINFPLYTTAYLEKFSLASTYVDVEDDDLRGWTGSSDNIVPTEIIYAATADANGAWVVKQSGGVMTGPLSTPAIILPDNPSTPVANQFYAYFDKLWYANQSAVVKQLAFDETIIKVISENTTLDNTYYNAIVRITATCTITIPSTLRIDFNCVFEAFGIVTATFVAGSGAVIFAPFGLVLKNNSMCTLYKYTSTTYRLNGGLTNA